MLHHPADFEHARRAREAFRALIGAVAAVSGLVAHALAHGRWGSFAGTLRAERYEVVADEEFAERAERRPSGPR